MRIWSIHPGYLDTKGLVALWREALLAKHVLEGKTKGYTNHPQLIRFKEMASPSHAINHYLSEIYQEAESRHYRFDKSKIDPDFKPVKMTVTRGQLDYEMKHLLHKLKLRDKDRFMRLSRIRTVDPAGIFRVVAGGVADWEIRHTD
jgi:hypothetical protein